MKSQGVFFSASLSFAAAQPEEFSALLAELQDTEKPEARLGGIAVGPAPVMRRRGAGALSRRPRFLARRRMGERRLMKRVACAQALHGPLER